MVPRGNPEKTRQDSVGSFSFYPRGAVLLLLSMTTPDNAPRSFPTNAAPVRKLQTWITASGCMGRVLSVTHRPQAVAKRWIVTIAYSGDRSVIAGSSFKDVQGRYMAIFA